MLSIRFEDLVSENREEMIRKIVEFYCEQSKTDPNVNEIVTIACNNINPRRSHTFRKGKVGGWKELYTDEHKDQMKAVAGELLIQLGYERTLDW